MDRRGDWIEMTNDSTTFQRGQFVRLTYGGNVIKAMVMLASGNGMSLMLGFDGALRTASGGMFPGAMPLLMDEAGVYRDLVENEVAEVEPWREQ